LGINLKKKDNELPWVEENEEVIISGKFWNIKKRMQKEIDVKISEIAQKLFIY
jgi:hypothetical protein